MNIISTIKNFFMATAGTPVTAPDFPSPNKSEGSSMAAGKRIDSKSVDLNFSPTLLQKTFRIIVSVIKISSKVFAGAITLVVLAHFAPELREQMPSLYRVVDLLLACIEWLCSQFWSIIPF